MIDDQRLRDAFTAQLEAFRELRLHLMVIKHVLRERNLVSDKQYGELLKQARAGFETMDAVAQREIEELNRIANLERPKPPEETPNS